MRLIVLANAGDARVRGAEIEARWFATEEWSLGLGVNLMDTKIKNGDYEGDRLIRSPRVMLSGLARYQAVQSFGGFTPFVQLDYSYNSSMEFILPNQVAAGEGSYWLLNGRAGVRLPDPCWEVSFFVENLTDKVYKTKVFGPGSTFRPAGILFGPPRLYGGTIRYAL